jgi:hypothetical protein
MYGKRLSESPIVILKLKGITSAGGTKHMRRTIKSERYEDKFTNDPYSGEINHLTKHIVNIKIFATVPTLLIQGDNLAPLEVWRDENLKKIYNEAQIILGELLTLRQKYYYDRMVRYEKETR